MRDEEQSVERGVDRVMRALRYRLIRCLRQGVFRLCYPGYRADPERHRIPLGVLAADVMIQRVFGVNREVPWPVHFTSRVTYPERINIGSTAKFCTAVNGGIYLQARNGITIGEGTYVAAGAKVVSANHDSEDLDVHRDGVPIVIGRGCWVGANAVVLPGVTLGDGVSVGAGAVVTKSQPPSVNAVGNPATARPRRQHAPGGGRPNGSSADLRASE